MKVGVVGAGVMGENHVRVYLSLSNECQLVGIYDNHFERAQNIADKYGTKYFNSLESLLDHVDAVSIAVPTELHYQVGMQCIDHHVDILMEKPITATVSEAEQLIRHANKNRTILQVGHIELYNPTVAELKNILANEEMLAVDVHRMSPFDARNLHVDVVNDLMIHDIYILDYLTNHRIQNFYGMGQLFDDTIKHAIVVARYTNGIIAQLTASFKTEEKVRTLRVITKNAFIQADLLENKILISRSTNFFKNKWQINYSQKNIVEKVFVPWHEPLKKQLSDFITSVKTKEPPKVTGVDGLNALEVTNRIHEYMKRYYSKFPKEM
ncbi:Gfo/Idh/MocA family protein [Melghirimyces algeriensis]|uniref:Predicted dehydrogenase n=1 Tax=Melghirimyces algeriensis TaxID=910412 RepID=A0A521CAR7_9BACL|nr:Gfo/Idh/MocA family oxidoreductase [Melghirimyces algeriensis]SMO56474.1 Predicted dehydrogenase [Melghirimyces algeriensis]